ncbi:CHAT domain-containing protein [Ideonella sp.]|uniref:CHAT domain-containing protein n=1 Tax=Ideonella sp. TaxID=1929293 RepID=UPI0035B0342F
MADVPLIPGTLGAASLEPAVDAMAWADAWLAADAPPPVPTGWAPTRARAAGWRLKDGAQQAWHSDPLRARRAADGLEALCTGELGGDAELQALAAWTAGLRALVDGDMAAALAALRRASAGLAGLGAAGPAAQAEVPTLVALSLLGRHDEAIACADRLESALRAAGDGLAAAKVALNRGSLLMRQDRYAEAAQGYRRAAVGFARLGDMAHSVMADIGLAGALTWQQQFSEAEAMAQRACQRAREHGLTVLQALAHGELGQLRLHAGRVGEALVEVEACAGLLEGRAPPQRRLEAERARADTHLAASLWPEALAACDRLVDLAESLHAPVEAAWSRLLRGQALALAGERRAAQADLAAARQAFMAAGNGAGAGRAAMGLAGLAAQDGRLDEAAEGLADAMQALGAHGVARWREEAELAWARLQVRRGRLAAALPALRRLRRAVGDGPLRAGWHLARAELAAARGRTVVAQRQAAAALGRLETWRRQVPAGDMRVACAQQAEAAHDLWVRLADAPERGTEAGPSGWALLAAIEHGRARSLHDELAQRAGALTAARATDVAAESDDDDGRQRVNWWLHQWQQAVGAGDVERASQWQALARQAEQDWARRERQRQALRLTAGARPAMAGPDLGRSAAAWADALPARLGEGRGLVAYHLDGDTWRAAVVVDGRCHRHHGQVPGLAARLASLRLQLDGMRGVPSRGDRHAVQRLQRVQALLRGLHDDLFAPLRAPLGRLRELVIVPHRALHGLPFAALHDGQAFLVDRVDVVMAPSVQAWQVAQARPAALDGPVGVFGAGSAWLPAIAAETSAVAEAWARHGPVHREERATVAAFQALAPQAAVLHLACHAVARPDNPAFSALHLHDGVVTMADVATCRLHAALVVLSACDTAVSRVAPGDEVLGVARGFLLAGARSVVASLWSVRDDTTAALMAAFHAACRAGASPPAALAAAQRALARTHPHPFHWAPFVVYGGGSPTTAPPAGACPCPDP